MVETIIVAVVLVRGWQLLGGLLLEGRHGERPRPAKPVASQIGSALVGLILIWLAFAAVVLIASCVYG